MSKPPAAPPSSDIGGVHRDRAAIDTPANAKQDPGERLDREESDNKGRPTDSRA